MAEPPTYKIVELVGSSPNGVDAAIANALERASKTLRNLDWFEVRQIQGALADGEIAAVPAALGARFLSPIQRKAVCVK